MKSVTKKSKSKKPQIPCARYVVPEMNIPTIMEPFYGEMLESLGGEFPIKAMFPVYASAGVIALCELIRSGNDQAFKKALITAFYLHVLSKPGGADLDFSEMAESLKNKVGLIIPDLDKIKVFAREMARTIE